MTKETRVQKSARLTTWEAIILLPNASIALFMGYPWFAFGIILLVIHCWMLHVTRWADARYYKNGGE